MLTPDSKFAKGDKKDEKTYSGRSQTAAEREKQVHSILIDKYFGGR